MINDGGGTGLAYCICQEYYVDRFIADWTKTYIWTLKCTICMVLQVSLVMKISNYFVATTPSVIQIDRVAWSSKSSWLWRFLITFQSPSVIQIDRVAWSSKSRCLWGFLITFQPPSVMQIGRGDLTTYHSTSDVNQVTGVRQQSLWSMTFANYYTL